MRYLGVDWGEKRIGLALGDSETKIATPLKVVAALDDVLAAVREEGADILVVGSPVSLAGRMPDRAAYIDFLKTLKDKSGLPVELADERLSSKAVDALSGSKKTKASRDALAAMLILQGYLDKT